MARAWSNEQACHEILACFEETPEENGDDHAAQMTTTTNAPLRTRFLQGPLPHAHGDYTERSGRTRAAQLLRPFIRSEQLLDDVLTKHRFAIINLWHPFKTVESDPLAMCTWSSCSPWDVVTTRITFPTRIGETYKVVPKPSQKWVYFSKINPDEAILLKVFDSKTDVARFTLHSAFTLPPADPVPPSRESMEIRLLVLYAPEAKHRSGACEDQLLSKPFVPPHMQQNLASHTKGVIEQPLAVEDVPPSGKW